MKRDLIRSSVMGIGIALLIFCITGVIFDLAYGGSFHLEHYSFTKMVLGSVIIGLGFGVPSVVYQYENLPKPVCVLIHLGIGITVYTIVAYAEGWIGYGENFWTGFVVPFAVQLAVILLIWFLFMKHYQKEARAINEKIQQMK